MTHDSQSNEVFRRGPDDVDLPRTFNLPEDFFDPKEEGEPLSEEQKRKLRDHINGELSDEEDREIFRLISENRAWRIASVEIDVENLNKAAMTLLSEGKTEKAHEKIQIASEIAGKHLEEDHPLLHDCRRIIQTLISRGKTDGSKIPSDS